MSLITLKNINKTYDNGKVKTEAIKDISLEIKKGDFIAIMGTSGSGKSTLLNILGCLDNATKGEYILNNNNIIALSNNEIAKVRNKTFGFVVQYFALLEDRTVFENIKIPLEYGKVPSKNHKSIVEDVLRKLNISDKIDATPFELSGGQCQRVAIARAIINTPDVILADEPTGALDSNTANEIMTIFEELNKEGKTIIIVTHDYKIASYCKRVITIKDGTIIEDKLN